MYYSVRDHPFPSHPLRFHSCLAQKTAAGILIPEKSQETLNRGEVLAVGPGTEKDKVTLKPGDIVVLPTYGGTVVNLGTDKSDESMILLRESEVLAKVIDA